MKITDQDYETLKINITPIMTREKANNYRQQGLSPIRFRWDCLYASKAETNDLYTYLNDSHIDTALKAIQHELNIKV